MAPPREPRSRAGEPGSGSGARAGAQEDRRARGREAEEIAARFLTDHGMEIVARNHAARRGEVDLVCRDGDVLCFVEVRSRASDAQGGPEETVGRRKARRVVAAATDWAARNGGFERAMRFDVVAITFGDGAPRIAHFRNAFDEDGAPGHW